MSRITQRAICAVLGLTLFSGAAQAALLDRGPTGIFGTMPLAVTNTPYNVRWARVLGSTVPSGSGIANRAAPISGLEQLRFVNTSVNRATAFVDDTQNGRASDTWSTARETLARGTGDCEDHAIAKMQILRAAGFPASDLFLVVGSDLGADSTHAILVVRRGAAYWVLDNLNDDVRPPSAYPGFRPIVSFSVNGNWLHGYPPGTSHSQILANRDAANPVGEGRLAPVVALQTGG